MSQKKSSFLTTTAGIIASIVTLATAVIGLITALPALNDATGPTPAAATDALASTSTPGPCPVAVDDRLISVWTMDRLGCPTEEALEAPLTWQEFERGSALWHGEPGHVYLLHTRQQTWEEASDVGGKVGGAAAEAQDYAGAIQFFRHGLIFADPDGARYVLYVQDGTWEAY